MNTNKRASLETYWKQYDQIKARHGIALRDIAIVCGEDANRNTRSACRKASELLAGGHFKRVLIINTSGNQRWALRIARGVSSSIGDDADSDTICMIGLEQGMLSRNIEQVRSLIERCDFDVVLINSWEMASANHRLREELIFRLHRLTSAGASVVIYSQASPKEYLAGKMLRGLGKLSALATVVTSLEETTSEEPEQAAETETQQLPSITEPEKAPLSERYVGPAGRLDATTQQEQLLSILTLQPQRQLVPA